MPSFRAKQSAQTMCGRGVHPSVARDSEVFWQCARRSAQACVSAIFQKCSERSFSHIKTWASGGNCTEACSACWCCQNSLGASVSGDKKTSDAGSQVIKRRAILAAKLQPSDTTLQHLLPYQFTEDPNTPLSPWRPSDHWVVHALHTATSYQQGFTKPIWKPPTARRTKRHTDRWAPTEATTCSIHIALLPEAAYSPHLAYTGDPRTN